MKKIYTFVLMLAAIAGILELFNLHLSGKIASDSVEVKKIQKNISELQEKNEVLNSQVLSLASLDIVASKAANLGFMQTQNYIFLNSPVEVALH